MKVAVFYPNNPWPPKAGTHVRCLQMLQGLRDAGGDVQLLSSDLWADPSWSREAIDGTRSLGLPPARVCRAHPFDRAWLKHMPRLSRSGPFARWAGAASTPPMLRRWLGRQLRRIAPELIVMNYIMFDRLLDHGAFNGARRVLETHGIMSINGRLRRGLAKRMALPIRCLEDVDPEALGVDFFESLHAEPLGDEFATHDRYDATIAICESDAQLMRSNTSRTTIHCIPIGMDVVDVENEYGQVAVFPTGLNNPFNAHGYALFAARVLPAVREAAPDFVLTVTGSGVGDIPAVPGVELRGFVPDLKRVYASAGFMVCPVIGGTGQQVKIVEAMAHGVPVVAWEQRAADSCMEDGVNGFLVRTPEAFAERVEQLWRDRELRVRLGRAAKETVAERFSIAAVADGCRGLFRGPAGGMHVRNAPGDTT